MRTSLEYPHYHPAALSHSNCFAVFKHCASFWSSFSVSAPSHRKKGWVLLSLTKGESLNRHYCSGMLLSLELWRVYAGSVLNKTQWIWYEVSDICYAENKMASNPEIYFINLSNELPFIHTSLKAPILDDDAGLCFPPTNKKASLAPN